MAEPQKPNWIAISGNWNFQKDGTVSFLGGEWLSPQLTANADPNDRGANNSPPQPKPETGNAICDRYFTEGEISVDIEFERIGNDQTAEIILQYEPAQRTSLHAGIGGSTDSLFVIRLWAPSDNNQNFDPNRPNALPRYSWTYFTGSGNLAALNSTKVWSVKVIVTSSKIDLIVNGVVTNSWNPGGPLPGKQVGLFAMGRNKITFKNFKVTDTKPQAFIVMQFNTKQFEDLYGEVISPVCEEVGLQPYRASDTYAPGIVISDIANQIMKSRIVIAEITPSNPNVFYEIGYADALKKPVILIADKSIEQLPFDVRAYRVIFYENSIGGKKQVESDLRRYLQGLIQKDLTGLS